MKKQYITFIIFSILFASCTTKNDKDFINYLKTSFNTQPVDSAIYLLIPANQCKNCVMLNGSGLSEELQNKLFIFSALPQKHFKGFKNFYYDKENKVGELKLIDYDNQFVFYNNNKIEFIIKARITDLQDVKACDVP